MQATKFEKEKHTYTPFAIAIRVQKYEIIWDEVKLRKAIERESERERTGATMEIWLGEIDRERVGASSSKRITKLDFQTNKSLSQIRHGKNVIQYCNGNEEGSYARSCCCCVVFFFFSFASEHHFILHDHNYGIRTGNDIVHCSAHCTSFIMR